jgi:hypothetical protein
LLRGAGAEVLSEDRVFVLSFSGRTFKFREEMVKNFELAAVKSVILVFGLGTVVAKSRLSTEEVGGGTTRGSVEDSGVELKCGGQGMRK